MKKIPTLFLRDEADRKYVTSEVNPVCQWVLDGEGRPTRKFDGTCCLVRDGKFYKRYEVKKGKTPPPEFEPADEVDQNTGKQPGWVPVGDGPEDKYHREAFDRLFNPPDGTYELVGPKIQGNAEHFNEHLLLSHATDTWLNDGEFIPRDYEGLRELLFALPDYEGIVFHHPDGRMAKVKKKDFQ